jgi:hypothetical protein
MDSLPSAPDLQLGSDAIDKDLFLGNGLATTLVALPTAATWYL